MIITQYEFFTGIFSSALACVDVGYDFRVPLEQDLSGGAYE